MDFQSYVKLPKGFVHKSSLTSPGHIELQLGEKHPSNPAQSSPIHNPPAFIKTWCPVLVYLFSLSSSNPLMGCYRRWKIIGNCQKIWKNLSQGSESKGVFWCWGTVRKPQNPCWLNPQNLGKSSGNPWLPWLKLTKSVEENQVQPTKNRAWQEAVLANKTPVLS